MSSSRSLSHLLMSFLYYHGTEHSFTIMRTQKLLKSVRITRVIDKYIAMFYYGLQHTDATTQTRNGGVGVDEICFNGNAVSWRRSTSRCVRSLHSSIKVSPTACLHTQATNNKSCIAEMAAQSCTIQIFAIKIEVPHFNALFLSNLREHRHKSHRGLLPKTRSYGLHFCWV